MNERIALLALKASDPKTGWLDRQKFAELIVKKVLDEVSTRAFVSGDRAWSDDADRHWVELEFGIGRLAKLKKKLRS
jgi:hypothetical protein